MTWSACTCVSSVATSLRSELAQQRGVAPRLLEHRIDQHRLARAGVAEQVRVRRRLRIEQLAEDQHGGSARGRCVGVSLPVGAHARSARRARTAAHAEQHRHDEHERLRVARAERDQRGPGTETGESPADAEQRGCRRRAAIDVARPRAGASACRAASIAAPAGERERDDADGDRAGHHQRQRRIPRPERGRGSPAPSPD